MKIPEGWEVVKTGGLKPEYKCWNTTKESFEYIFTYGQPIKKLVCVIRRIK